MGPALQPSSTHAPEVKQFHMLYPRSWKTVVKNGTRQSKDSKKRTADELDSRKPFVTRDGHFTNCRRAPTAQIERPFHEARLSRLPRIGKACFGEARLALPLVLPYRHQVYQ